MITLRKAIMVTPKKKLVRALMQCRTTITRSILEIDEFGNKRKNVAGLVRATDGDRFCVVMFYEPEKKNLTESKVWVHCSCEDFLYCSEYALAKVKSSDIINSNGQPPVIKNPRMIPMICKHLVSLAKLAVKARAKDMTPKEEPESKIKTIPNKALPQKKPTPPKRYTNKPLQRPQQFKKAPPIAKPGGPKPPPAKR